MLALLREKCKKNTQEQRENLKVRHSNPLRRNDFRRAKPPSGGSRHKLAVAASVASSIMFTLHDHFANIIPQIPKKATRWPCLNSLEQNKAEKKLKIRNFLFPRRQ
jgi:hypothetical protein